MKSSVGIYRRLFKRPMDFILSFLAIVIFSPIILFIYIMVRVKLGKPAIFKQRRPGLNEKIFTLYKFRTMTNEKDIRGNLLPDFLRMTKFGRFLRASSLDELLELFNILRGDMSIVGPRPLLEQYLSIYNEKHKRRHDVRPGLTGLAQVSGRNDLNWNDRLDLDVEYIDNITFLGDCKILLLTILTVIRREGINSKTSVTMEPYKGNPEGRVM